MAAVTGTGTSTELTTAPPRPSGDRPARHALPIAAGEQGTDARAPDSPMLPTPSLPKGGGAIRGMGESVTVNPARGTGALSIPVGVSPGRRGAGLTLTLGYDSGGGSSPYGLGFDLAVPRVSRKTSRGVPRYTDDDTFALTGMDDLVPALVERGGDWVPDVHTEAIDGVAHDVTAFRPRVEGEFARVERCRPATGDDTFWRTVSRDNVTSTYGRTAAARVAAPGPPGGPARVFEWLLQEIRDDRGNVTVYEYKPEDLTGVDPADLWERHRLGGPAPTGRYLKRIRYANRMPGADDTSMLVVLDYGEHELAPDEVRPWPVRADPYSSYRSGFEIRTWRLCQRVLMFHDFGAALGDGPLPRLVTATELTHAADPVATKLVRVRRVGYEWVGGAYVTGALPPLEFSYTTSAPDDQVRTVQAPPIPDATGVHWVDLDADGLPGALTRTPRGWWYQRNNGAGALDVPRVVTATPNHTDRPPRFADLDGDGRLSLVDVGPDLFGFATRTDDGSWSRFTPFANVPVIDLASADLRHVDLDGDGLPDLLVGDADGVRWHPSLGRDGYGPAQWVPGNGTDEELGPRLAYSDEQRAIFLADLSGDGLVDIVRIRNGEVCYWPSLGYGRFGAKVTMAGAPVFDHPDLFHPARIRLADINGAGPVDLVYLGRERVQSWINQSGNAFGPATDLGPFPLVDSITTVDVVDLLGSGTGCLVWSSPTPAAAGRPVRYLDLSRGTSTGLAATDPRLAGWKPHLLCRVTNSMGAVHDLEYAPSTRYSLADRQAGQPWRTRLAFPVHVVATSTLTEQVTGTTVTTGYRYRDGYFDGPDREFRGFGMTETTDAQAFPGPPQRAPTFDVPPVRTRTWFHLGAAYDTLTGCYTGDPGAVPLPGHGLSEATTGAEFREALRALAGQALRVEVYADDGVSTDPYSVVEHRYHVRRVQPVSGERHGVFFPYALESVTTQYERQPADPRTSQALTIDVDAYGVVRSAVAIGYPRRVPAVPQQGATLATWTLTEVAHTDTLTVHRLGVSVSTQIFEVTGLPAPGPGTRLGYDQVAAALPGLADIPYEHAPSPGTPQRRLVEYVRTEYWADDQSAALPFGQPGARALARCAYRVAFTPGLLAEVYGPRVTAAMLTGEGGYLDADGAWWAPSVVTGYDPAAFYAPTTSTSPFGTVTTVAYDAYHLLVDRITAAETAPYNLLVTTVDNDYRVLGPRSITDPNGDRSTVQQDALTNVTAVWVQGRDGEGDPDPLPGTVFSYDQSSWANALGPVWAQAETRERHGDAASPVQRVRVYTDGLGRAAMTKMQAEPGLAWTVDGSGGGVLVDTTPALRWVGTGRTVYNNKGLAVEQYEPYFAVSEAYEDEDALVKQGVTPVLRYDPLGRLVRTDHPDGTTEAVEFDAWQHVAADRNDTVLESQWYATRQTAGTPADQARAATLTAAHAHTPTVSVTDTLGRVVRTRSDDGAGGIAESAAAFDIEGNRVSVSDARGLAVLTSRYDLHGRAVHTASPDAGERFVLHDVTGVPIRGWDSRGFARRMTFDPLRRPVGLFVTDAGGERMTQACVYGEAQGPHQRHLGRVYEIYDAAGRAVNDAYDFKGNVLRTSRRLCADHRTPPDWPAGLGDALLDTETFTGTAAYDALNRAVQVVLPHSDQPGATVSVSQSGFNASGLLDRVDLWLQQPTEPTTLLASATATHPIVSGLDYDAKGQCTTARYANGVRTDHEFDPLTWRLTHLSTTRGADKLQDLTYTYDPMGNVLAIADAANDTVFHKQAAVTAGAEFTYDPLYRLTAASGRERDTGTQTGPDDSGRFVTGALPNDDQSLRNYVEIYAYDLAGNITGMRHHQGHDLDAPGTVLWNRRYQYAVDSNRLLATSEPGDPTGLPTYAATGGYTSRYGYDPHGNMVTMPHLTGLVWDDRDLLTGTQMGGGGTAYYAHDAAGERVRKVWEKQAGLVEERIYLGGIEFFRRRTGPGTLSLERETVHVSAGAERVAMVETRTVGSDPAPAQVVRYQLGDHLGSSTVEVDAAGAVITYEEYYPYGSTAYQAGRSVTETPKRYRFTGRERDEESGLTVHGQRYYAPWLGRWTSCDPGMLVDGTNVYRYCQNNPLAHTDPDGTQSWPLQAFPTPQVPHALPPPPPQLVVSNGRMRMVYDGHVIEDRPAPVEDTTPPSPDTPDSAWPDRPPDEGGSGGYFAAGVAYGVAMYQASGGMLGAMPWEITGKHHAPDDEKEFMRGAAWGMMLASTRDMARSLAIATEAGHIEGRQSSIPGRLFWGGPSATAWMVQSMMVEANLIEAKATAGAAAASILMKKGGGSASSGPPPAPDKGDYRGRFNADRIAKGKKPLPAEYDAHHRIPQEYRNNAEFKDFDFDAPDNVRGVKGTRALWAGKAKANYHQEITNWWSLFRQDFPHATRAEIEAFANQIDKGYAKYYFR
jgi:RHS repeat-associated protein